MNFEWIKCEDKLPEMPKNPLEEKTYLVACKHLSGYYYQTMTWADGWNCSVGFDGTVHRESEIKSVVAWAETPEYEE